MKIVTDDKIPYVNELFGDFGEITQKPGTSINHDDLADAEVLLTRTVTHVDARLLNDTPIKFVGSATAGYNHLDIKWLSQAGIFYCYAPGINATTVADYVVSCVAFLNTKNLLSEKCRAGIIGLGHIGTEVKRKLSALNFEIICNDPPRAQLEADFHSTPLSEFYDLDIICIHTPLSTNGKFPTYHLINKSLLTKLKSGCILLNAGRGAVVDNSVLSSTKRIVACLDVWENEPNINLDMLRQAKIATPHIAGYSLQAKFKATHAIYKKFIRHFNLQDPHQDISFEPLNNSIKLSVPESPNWQQVVLKAFDPYHETKQMKKELLNSPRNTGDQFEKLRCNYQLRNEFSAFKIQNPLSQATRTILKKLDFK